MMDTFLYYIIAILVFIVAVAIIKKVARCLFKTIITLIALAIIGALVYMYKQYT